MLHSPRRHFLSWDRPLLPQAVVLLAEGWSGPAPLDLSDVLVVVPTRQSGRRLREALANHAAAQHAAVFPPQVLTPEALAAASAGDHPPSRLERLCAWIDVLRGINLAEFRAVFPIDPPARDFNWAFRLAEQFVRLQSTLNENGLRITDVPHRVGPDFPEADRWDRLAALERCQAEALRRAGLEPAAAPAADWADGINRVVLLAVADPLPAALAALAAVPPSCSIDVVVHAPAEEAERFDAWGRPLTDAWSERPLTLGGFAGQVHLCADPADQADKIAALVKAYGAENGAAEGRLAIGLADPEITRLAESAIGRIGIAVFNPEGVPRRATALYHLLTALARTAPTPTFEAVEALARCPDFLRFVVAAVGGYAAAQFLADLDELRRSHLPPDLESALARAREPLASALRVVAEILVGLRREPFPDALAEVLQRIYAGRALEEARPADEHLVDAANAWMAMLAEAGAAAARFPAIEGAEWWQIALRAFGDSRRTEDKPADAIELQGWLELLFEDTPHLVIAGLNDGLVPEAVGEDMFLPESLRTRLGLKTNAARLARDAYLLQAMAASRQGSGRLDLLLGKTSAIGDPLRPSRLLLRCPDEDLPARVDFLFCAPEPAGSHLPWTRAWPLRPRRIPAPARVAVTSLRRWLLCPFRFYLQYGLKMEAVDAAKSEMDAFDFGTLCHAALEAMGRDATLRDCTDAAVLREFLIAELTRKAHERYGDAMTLPLLIQFESARQRLGKVAEIQAAERAAGWVIQDVERPFTVTIAGLAVNGKIDRIDRQAGTGRVRVVDYKTSDTAVTPRGAHWRAPRRDESPADWTVVMAEGKPRVWVDLQLPLYRHALAAEFGAEIDCGYLNLPKAVGLTAFALWEGYTPELQESALRCAEGVCTAIRSDQFWPPNEAIRPDNDDFATLFQQGAAASVAWS